MSGDKTVTFFGEIGEEGRLLIPSEQGSTIGIMGQRAETCFGAAVNGTIHLKEMSGGFQGCARQFGEVAAYALVLKGDIFNPLTSYGTPALNPKPAKAPLPIISQHGAGRGMGKAQGTLHARRLNEWNVPTSQTSRTGLALANRDRKSTRLNSS